MRRIISTPNTHATRRGSPLLSMRGSAVTQGSGKSVKDAIKKCLREHAAEFDLANEDGNPNETGIDEVAKVANWQPTGGAPKTPASNLPPGSPATIGYACVAHPNPPPSAKIYAPFGL
jgi:hypothetical protein